MSTGLAGREASYRLDAITTIPACVGSLHYQYGPMSQQRWFCKHTANYRQALWHSTMRKYYTVFCNIFVIDYGPLSCHIFFLIYTMPAIMIPCNYSSILYNDALIKFFFWICSRSRIFCYHHSTKSIYWWYPSTRWRPVSTATHSLEPVSINISTCFNCLFNMWQFHTPLTLEWWLISFNTTTTNSWSRQCGAVD